MVYEPKFYKCGECDAILEAVTPQCCDELCCCGKPMELLKANEMITLEEKHMPVVKREGNNLAGDVKPTFVNTHLFDAIFPFVPFGFHVLPPSSFYSA